MALGDPSRKTRRAPGPRPVTASYLRNAAMQYVASRAASVAMVRELLHRRARRRLAVPDLPPETVALVDAAVAELVALGLVDDARYAGGRAMTLARKGLPRRRIASGLQAKGLSRDIVEQALGDGVDELAQARRYIERRRLGTFRRGGLTPESRKKDLAALARAGFAFAVAAAALDAPPD